MTVQKVSAGLVEDLRAAGRLTTKLGSLPVLVVADGDEVHAIEDRCPHLGFPLARGAVGDGIITCHWHHARFDLASGCTFDPWADDARAFDVEVADGQVWVCERADVAGVEHHERRLREGLEGDISLVTAKAVLALLDEPDGVERVLRTPLDFGLSHRGPGWGSGMTILVAMANVVPHLRPGDRLRLRWRFQRPPEWLEQLSLGLEARRYDCVNSRQLHQQKQRGHRGSFEVAQRIEVCDLDHPDAIREGEAAVELPTSMKTSRVADNPGSGQGIVWFVTADGRGRTGFSESFEIRIEHEGARSRRIRRKRKKKERRGRARRPVR